jgi:hypothetical protein
MVDYNLRRSPKIYKLYTGCVVEKYQYILS